MPPDPPSFGMLRMHVCFAYNERTSPLKMPDHLCKGCSSPARGTEFSVYFINGEDCHVTLIVKWLANGRLTVEAMSPKLVVSLL